MVRDVHSGPVLHPTWCSRRPIRTQSHPAHLVSMAQARVQDSHALGPWSSQRRPREPVACAGPRTTREIQAILIRLKNDNATGSGESGDPRGDRWYSSTGSAQICDLLRDSYPLGSGEMLVSLRPTF